MIEIKNLQKSFGAENILKKVSLEIKNGEFFSLLGPSGCGKTTLLRIIGGFETASQGEVWIDGESVLGMPARNRTTNMVFQHLALFPHLSVERNIAFGLEVKKVPKDLIAKKVSEVLDLIQLESLAHRAVDELSGGQRQRVAIARALVNEPKVLLLDEPLGALDLQLRLQMQAELANLQRSLNSTFVFVTHDQAEAMTMSDRIAVMNKGEILQIGTPREIYETPQHRFVAEFIGHANFFRGILLEPKDEDGFAVMRYGEHVLRGISRSDVPAGTRVTLGVRYEKTTFSVASEPGSMAGQINQLTFTGPTVRAEVILDGDLGVAKVEMSANASLASLSQGQRVWVSWIARDANVFSD